MKEEEEKVKKVKKDCFFNLRMTAETKAEILEKRKIYGVSTTAKFLTELLTTLTVKPIDKDHKRVMAGIGTNLNQISKSLNIAIKNGWEFPKDLMERLAKIEEQIYK